MKYIIIGLGNYGGGLAEELMAIGHEVIGVDQNEGRVDNLKDKITTAFVLDATDELVRKITGKYPIYARAPYGEVPENRRKFRGFCTGGRFAETKESEAYLCPGYRFGA
mgnify:CR=1 FL=1